MVMITLLTKPGGNNGHAVMLRWVLLLEKVTRIKTIQQLETITTSTEFNVIINDYIAILFRNVLPCFPPSWLS